MGLSMADGVGVPPPNEIKALGWQTGQYALFEGKGLFGRLANQKSTGDGPPESKTAAPTDIGSGGKKTGKLAGVSGDEFYYTDLCTATLPRIIATHFGVAS